MDSDNFQVIAIPGMLQFRRKDYRAAGQWFIGTALGYAFCFVPGLISHAVYVTRTRKALQNDPNAMEPASDSGDKSILNSLMTSGALGFLFKPALDNYDKSRSCSKCGCNIPISDAGTTIGFCAICALQNSGLLAANDEPAFIQLASYREGLPEHPQESDNPGRIYIAAENIYFVDSKVVWKCGWTSVQEVGLDYFKPSGFRAVMAGGATARMLQQVKNNVAITYHDDHGTQWTAKFQVHGALSIPGEERKATELLGQIIRYKPLFRKRLDSTSPIAESPHSKIEALFALKEKGIISEEDFETKKRELLSKI